MTHPSVKEAITKWRAGSTATPALMRRLVSFDAWLCPVSQDSVAEMLATNAASRLSYSRNDKGVTRLYVFSDSDAVTEFRSGVGEQEEWHLLQTKGTWFFQLPLTEIDFIVLDPGSDTEWAYAKEQFGALAKVAQAIEIERVLAALRTGTALSGTVQQVADYEHYLLAAIKRTEGHSLALAPDSRGRRLAAIFTAQDAFDAFCAEQGPQQDAGALVPLELPGVQLFAQLQRMQLDGIVFNCSGPTQPVAFAPAFSQVVLEAAGQARA